MLPDKPDPPVAQPVPEPWTEWLEAQIVLLESVAEESVSNAYKAGFLAGLEWGRKDK